MTIKICLINGYHIEISPPPGMGMPDGLDTVLEELFNPPVKAAWITRESGDMTPTEGYVEWINSGGISGKCYAAALSWDSEGHPVVRYRHIDKPDPY